MGIVAMEVVVELVAPYSPVDNLPLMRDTLINSNLADENDPIIISETTIPIGYQNF